MIRLTSVTSSGYRTHYVNPENIARITEASASSQWHGIRTFVKLFDGETLECSEGINEVHALIEAAKP